MVPLIYGAYALGTIYASGRLVDTARYWHDYKKNTGYSPRYPFIRGWGESFRTGAGMFYGLKSFDNRTHTRYTYKHHYNYR